MFYKKCWVFFGGLKNFSYIWICQTKIYKVILIFTRVKSMKQPVGVKKVKWDQRILGNYFCFLLLKEKLNCDITGITISNTLGCVLINSLFI